MMPFVAPTVHDRLRACAVYVGRNTEHNRDEICGLLYQHAIIVVANVAMDPVREYAMDADEQFKIMNERGWPEAVWHTHPGGTREPSTLDLASALPGIPQVIGWAGGAGVWVGDRQVMEVMVAKLTNDIGELYEDDGGKWRWRRVSANSAIIASSGESFDSKRNAARALYRANPDLVEDEQQSLGSADVADLGTVMGGSATGETPGPATGAPGTGSGGNAYGVGPTG